MPVAYCTHIINQLREADPSVLGELYGEDVVALEAFVHLLKLYRTSHLPAKKAARRAMPLVLKAMRASTRHVAKRALDVALDVNTEAFWRTIDPNKVLP